MKILYFILIFQIPDRNISFPKNTSRQNASILNNKSDEDLQSMHSFELFSENNMDPIDDQDFITKPRRNLENIDLFEGISDEESILNESKNNDDNDSDDANITLISDDEDKAVKPATLLNTSRPTTPPILEEFIKIEPVSPNHSNNLNKTKSKENINKENSLKFRISNMDCWLVLGNMGMLTKTQESQLQDKFPRSFNWLLETCAQTINVDWSSVYEQLLCIELMFCMGIQDPSTIKNCVYIKGFNKYKDIESLLKSYREIW